MVSESRETTFDATSRELAELERILDGLVRRAVRWRSVDQQRCGRTIGIKVRLDDFSTHTRARTLAEPVERRRPRRPGGASTCSGGSRRRGRCACSASAWPASSRPCAAADEQLTLAL